MLFSLVALSSLLTLVAALPSSQHQPRQAASSGSTDTIPTITLVNNCSLEGHFSLTFGSSRPTFAFDLPVGGTSNDEPTLVSPRPLPSFSTLIDDGPYLYEKNVSDAFTAGGQLTTFFLNVSLFSSTTRRARSLSSFSSSSSFLLSIPIPFR